jgi:hypothetical protein
MVAADTVHTAPNELQTNGRENETGNRKDKPWADSRILYPGTRYFA